MSVITVRLSKKKHVAIANLAWANGVSMNQLCVFLIDSLIQGDISVKEVITKGQDRQEAEAIERAKDTLAAKGIHLGGSRDQQPEGGSDSEHAGSLPVLPRAVQAEGDRGPASDAEVQPEA